MPSMDPALATELSNLLGNALLENGMPQEIATRANILTRGFSPSNQDFFVRNAVPRLAMDMLRPGRGQVVGYVSAGVAAKAFLSLNVSTIIASGSALGIGVVSAFVVSAGAIGYGTGTLINRTFNLSDRIGDGLYNFFN